MTQPVVYLDRFTIREGKLDDLRRYCEEMSDLVEHKEPDTLLFSYFVDEAGREGTAVFVFADAAALDHHLQVTSHKFQDGVALIETADIELLGPASEQAQAMSRDYGAAIKAGILAGFARTHA